MEMVARIGRDAARLLLESLPATHRTESELWDLSASHPAWKGLHHIQDTSPYFDHVFPLCCRELYHLPLLLRTLPVPRLHLASNYNIPMWCEAQGARQLSREQQQTSMCMAIVNWREAQGGTRSILSAFWCTMFSMIAERSYR